MHHTISKLLVYSSQSSSGNIINLERRILADGTSLSSSMPHRNRVTSVRPQSGTPQHTLERYWPAALICPLNYARSRLSCRFLIGNESKHFTRQVRCNKPPRCRRYNARLNCEEIRLLFYTKSESYRTGQFRLEKDRIRLSPSEIHA